MTADPTAATTRGQLLREADQAIDTADRALLSARRSLPVLLWSVGLLVMVFVQGGADLTSNDSSIAFFPALAVLWWLVAKVVPGKAFVGHLVAFVVIVVVGAVATPTVEDLDGSAARTAFLVVWAAMALGVAWTGAKYVLDGHRLLAEGDRWRSARRDPALRELDDTDVTPEVATVHDLRDRTDYDSAVAQVVARHQGRLSDLRTVKPTFVLMIPGVLGLAFFLAPIVGLDDSTWAAASSVSGLLLLAPWAWASVADMGLLIVGRQQEANRVGVESQLYAARRHHTSGAPIAPRRKFTLLGTSAGSFLLIAWTTLLVVRIRSSSAPVLLIALAITVLAAVIVIVRMVRRRGRTRVYPLEGTGDSVLQAPARAVALRLDGESLEITDVDGRAQPRTIPLADIVALESVTGTAAFGGDGLGIVTTGAPVVVAGKKVEQEPAIVGLRRLLDERVGQ